MAATKRSRPSSSDDVCNMEVQQPSLDFEENNVYEHGFEENNGYEHVFEENMRFLETDINRPYDGMADQAWNIAWNSLLLIKAKWSLNQNRASLAIPIPMLPNASEQMWNGDVYKLRDKFQRMYAYLERFPTANKAREELIKESMIAEWPRTYVPFSEGGEVKSLTVDRAPILHVSMNTNSTDVKRWRPTVQLSVLALNKENAKNLRIRFTARLVTQNSAQVQSNEPWETVGRLICTQRMGKKVLTIGTGIHCNGNALVTAGGIDEQGALWYDDKGTLCAHSPDLASPCTPNYEQGALWFDDTGTLCARFSDLGVNTSGRQNRRKTSRQRYCIEIISEIRLANGLKLEHSTLSHPFLIVPNYDQNETILGDIIWDILSAEKGNTNTPVNERKVTWQKVRLMMKHYVQSQLIEARALDKEELFHLQTMLFLPLARSPNDPLELEIQLFGNNVDYVDKQGIRKIKYRLLREPVRDDYPVNFDSFFTQNCIELKDYKSELKHSVWKWLSEAVEMIIDRNNTSLLCEDLNKPKSKKNKKSSMMLKIFNDRIITMSSRERVWIAYKMLSKYDTTRHLQQRTLTMVIRFCESKAGSLSFGYSNTEGSELKPTNGSITAKEVKQMKDGLRGMVMEAPWPSLFDRLVRFKCDNAEGRSGVSFPRKQQVFKPYESTANYSPPVQLLEKDPLEIDPVNGPTVFLGLKSSPYLNCSSNSESPQQAQTSQILQPHSSSYSVDPLEEGWAVVHKAIGWKGLKNNFATMSVSTASSSGNRLSKSKKNSDISQHNSFSYQK
uniref:Uncharacterized protein n=1 Tax=Plectus sambesii TaxID=2011161 RepID=A0A914WRD1_9BILA